MKKRCKDLSVNILEDEWLRILRTHQSTRTLLEDCDYYTQKEERMLQHNHGWRQQLLTFLHCQNSGLLWSFFRRYCVKRKQIFAESLFGSLKEAHYKEMLWGRSTDARWMIENDEWNVCRTLKLKKWTMFACQQKDERWNH